jgi:hypothetical protein
LRCRKGTTIEIIRDFGGWVGRLKVYHSTHHNTLKRRDLVAEYLRLIGVPLAFADK